MEDREWTRNEMIVFKNGWAALSAAVIQQWKDDGCPKGYDMDYWNDCLRTLIKHNGD